LLEEVAKELSPPKEKGLSLHLDCGDKALSKVMSDRLELHRLFTNLVGKRLILRMWGSCPPETYSDPTTAPRNEQSVYYITIGDTGPGIPVEEPPCLKDFAREAISVPVVV